MSHRQKYPPCGGANHGNRCYGQRRVKCECFPSVLPLAPPVGGPTTARGATANAEASASAFPPTLFFGALFPPKRGGVLPHKGPPHLWGGPVAWRVAPPVGGPTSLPSCHWPPHSVGGPRRLVLRRAPRQMRVLSLPPFFLVPHPPQNGGECCHTKAPPTFGGGPVAWRVAPPCGGANFPSLLPLAPPIVWGGHGAWCYGERRGKCECFPSHPFFWCLIPPKTGGSVATQRPPPPLGGAQLRGGWPPLWGGQLPFPLATGPPLVWGGQPRRLVLR